MQCDWPRLLAEPDCFFQAHDGPAYDVKFYGDGEDALLLRFKLVLDTDPSVYLLLLSYDELH